MQFLESHIGHYPIQQRIGGSEMGGVYSAEDLQFERSSPAKPSEWMVLTLAKPKCCGGVSLPTIRKRMGQKNL
jgi:hypothetical protein